MGRLEGRRVAVTGAGRGIGRAISLAAAAEGATLVWALDLDAGILPSLAAEADAIAPRAVDVSDPAAVSSFAAEVGRIDVLVNCAGVVHHGTVLDCTPDEWAVALEVNVTSMYLMIRALLPGMLEVGSGSIVNIASVVSSVKGVPNRFAYGTSKAAVIGLTKSVAADYISSGVRCNAIAPGTVDTPSFRVRAGQGPDPEATLAAFVARQPMGRLGSAEEVAALAIHLASDEAGFTTGSVFVTDGGMSL